LALQYIKARLNEVDVEITRRASLRTLAQTAAHNGLEDVINRYGSQTSLVLSARPNKVYWDK